MTGTCFLLLLLVTLASADKVVRELPAMHTNVTIFQGSVANIHKTFQLVLPLGNSKIVVNTADTIDPSSIQVTVIPKDSNVNKDVVVRSHIYTMYSLTHSFIHVFTQAKVNNIVMNSVTRTKELNPKFIACENSIKTVNSTLYMNYESLINELRMTELKIKTGENYFTSNNKQLNIAELLDLQDKTMSLLFEQYNNVKQKLNDNSVDIRLLREMYDLLKSGGIINPLSLKTVGGGHVCTPEVLIATTTKECTISISVNSLNFYSSVELNFHMHYFVTGATWIPSYDFTINSKGKKYFLDVDTFGIVKQSTGEDWLDTILILGTSQVSVELSRQEIN